MRRILTNVDHDLNQILAAQTGPSEKVKARQPNNHQDSHEVRCETKKMME